MIHVWSIDLFCYLSLVTEIAMKVDVFGVSMENPFLERSWFWTNRCAWGLILFGGLLFENFTLHHGGVFLLGTLLSICVCAAVLFSTLIWAKLIGAFVLAKTGNDGIRQLFRSMDVIAIGGRIFDYELFIQIFACLPILCVRELDMIFPLLREVSSDPKLLPSKQMNPQIWGPPSTIKILRKKLSL